MTREQWLAQRPALAPENELVIKVWNFCGGWNPVAVPLAAAFYDIDDADFLLEQLMVVRDKLAAHQDALRGSGK